MSKTATTDVSPRAPAAVPGFEPIPLAAESQQALDAMAGKVADWLVAHPEAGASELARRGGAQGSLPYRRVFFARGREEAVRSLRAPPGPRAVSGCVDGVELPIGFLLSGPSNEASLREIYDREPTFRREFDRCVDLAMDAGDRLPVMLDTPPAIEDPDAMLFLFAVEYALCQLWIRWGISPQLMMGYSFGEFVAAAVSGVFELRDALVLAGERGRLLQTLERGAMTAVGLSETDVRPFLSETLRLAIVRSARACVVSGDPQAMADFEARLDSSNVVHQRLDLPMAGHSLAAERIAPVFAQKVAEVPRHVPRISMISNVSGELLESGRARAPEYWGEQLSRTVQFAAGLQSMARAGCRILLEVGPGHHLTSLASQQLKPSSGVHVLPSLRGVMGEPSSHLALLRSAARLWTLGAPIDWSAVFST